MLGGGVRGGVMGVCVMGMCYGGGCYAVSGVRWCFEGGGGVCWGGGV